MNNTLLDNANVKKATASEILKETKVIEMFSQIGSVEIIGSLRLDLMFRNDIDLLVISEEIENSKAVEITEKLLKSKQFRTVGFADYQTYPGFDMPLGYYWELIVIKDNEQWKFDVWYLKPSERYTKLVIDSINNFEKELAVHPEKREIILRIKDSYFDGVKYKDRVKSIDIYKAVLERGVRSIEEFRLSLIN